MTITLKGAEPHNLSDVQFYRPAENTQKGMMLIVGAAFVGHPRLNEFVVWKRKLGFNTKVYSVADIGTSAEEIRRFLKTTYAQWDNPGLDYLLLIGDVEHVPTKQIEERHTDNYYAAIDGPEYKIDKISPDLAVGRLPVKTEDELDAVLEKIMTYEKGRFQDKSWIKQVSFISTDDRQNSGVAEKTHRAVIKKYAKKSGYMGRFPKKRQRGGDQLFAIGNKAKHRDLIKMFSKGRSIIHYSGHGSETSWEGPVLKRKDVRALSHPSARPYVVGFACDTGSFADRHDSFAETWIKSPGAAIAYYGTSDSSYWDEDDILERSMWKGIVDKKIRRIGDINQYAMSGVRARYRGKGETAYYYEIYNLMGDPSVKLFTDHLGPLQIEVKTDLLEGIREVSLMVTDQQGDSVEGAVVNIFNGGVVGVEKSYVGFTNSDGKALIDLSPAGLSPDGLLVVISAPNYEVAEEKLPVFKPNGPYVVAGGLQFDAHNQALIPGQVQRVQINFTNIGLTDDVFSISILERPEWLEIIQLEEFACQGISIAAKKNATCSAPFVMKLNQEMASGVLIPVVMLATSGSGATNKFTLDIPVINIQAQIEDPVLQESKGNGDQFVNPGETWHIQYRVKNIGKIDMTQVALRVGDPTQCLQFEENLVSTTGVLTSQAAATMGFTFHVNDLCATAHKVTVEAVLSPVSTSYVISQKQSPVAIGSYQEIVLNRADNLTLATSNPAGFSSIIQVNTDLILSDVMVAAEFEQVDLANYKISIRAPSGKHFDLQTGFSELETGELGASVALSEKVNRSFYLENVETEKSVGSWTLIIENPKPGPLGGVIKNWQLTLNGFVQQKKSIEIIDYQLVSGKPAPYQDFEIKLTLKNTGSMAHSLGLSTDLTQSAGVAISAISLGCQLRLGVGEESQCNEHYQIRVNREVHNREWVTLLFADADFGHQPQILKLPLRMENRFYEIGDRKLRNGIGEQVRSLAPFSKLVVDYVIKKGGLAGTSPDDRLIFYDYSQCLIPLGAVVFPLNKDQLEMGDSLIHAEFRVRAPCLRSPVASFQMAIRPLNDPLFSFLEDRATLSIEPEL